MESFLLAITFGIAKNGGLIQPLSLAHRHLQTQPCCYEKGDSVCVCVCDWSIVIDRVNITACPVIWDSFQFKPPEDRQYSLEGEACCLFSQSLPNVAIMINPRGVG